MVIRPTVLRYIRYLLSLIRSSGGNSPPEQSRFRISCDKFPLDGHYRPYSLFADDLAVDQAVNFQIGISEFAQNSPRMLAEPRRRCTDRSALKGIHT